MRRNNILLRGLVYYTWVLHAKASSTSSSSGSKAKKSTTLADFHPALAQTWLTASSNKMLQPQHVAPNSRKLAWWCCPACQHQFTKRIDLHVAAGGQCPSCKAKPSLDGRGSSNAASKKSGRAGGTEEIVHRCRPKTSQATLQAENSNRIKKSVADGAYLRVKDTRNLMPMLAKNYEKESKKIAADEIVYVSPKLDGIRCVAAYDAKAKQILFFSRAGTLFECCDAKIEPALRYAFEKDPQLVLDGELYNDSSNIVKMSTQKDYTGVLRLLLDASTGDSNEQTTKQVSKKAHNKKSDVIGFEQLTSAIRTTRDRLTPPVAALQEKLQYHVFDLLYATSYGDSPCFSERYRHLTKLIADVNANNAKSLDNYDPRVLRLVPALPCLKNDVPDVLRSAMKAGYEGVMVRRDGLKGGHIQLPSSSSNSNNKNGGMDSEHFAVASIRQARKRINDVAASIKDGSTSWSSDTSGGYGYGQRSSCLLKYKVMQDAEFVIISAVEGKGKWKGCLGAFVCQTKDKKHTFTVTPASTDAQKKAMWRNWKTEYMGKALTVQYQDISADGVPRFPVGKSVRGAANGKDWI